MENKRWFRTYIYIWIGQFVSLLTSSAVNFAMIIWLSLEHKSAEVLAWAGIAGLLPQAVIGPFAGVFIDRWDRKKVMIFADAFIAFCTVLMAFILQTNENPLLYIYIMLGCRSIGSAFHSPAMQAIAPLLVPEKELLRISGINQMLQSVSSIAGPALGTLAITYFSIGQVLYLDVIGAATAIFSLLFVTIPHIKIKTKTSIFGVWFDLKDGLRAIVNNRGLSLLFLYTMIATFCIMPVAIMFPLLTMGHYGGGKWEMSVIEVVWGVGMLVGGAVVGIPRFSYSKIIMVNIMNIVLGLTFVLSGGFPTSWFIAFAIITTLGGIAMSIFSAAFMTIIQQEVRAEMLGRVFSLYFSLAILPSAVGLFFTGLIAEVIGVSSAFILSGSIVILVGISLFFTPSVMRLGKP